MHKCSNTMCTLLIDMYILPVGFSRTKGVVRCMQDLGGGFTGQHGVEDEAVPVLGIGIDMDRGLRTTFLSKQIQTIQRLQSCLGHAN